MKVSELLDMNTRIKLATAKLKTQVHKASVAAAKAPRLELGVVGLSIGQEQSTGLTSRVNEVSASAYAQYLAQKSGGHPDPTSRQLPISIRVKDAKAKIKASTFSQHDEDALLDALGGHRETDTLSLRDIDTISAITNVDVQELRDVLGLGDKEE